VAPYYAPKLKKRTALFERLREIFRQHISWPVETVIAKINPILRGWVNYFRVGHSSICFGVIKPLGRGEGTAAFDACPGRKGFGWTRWSSEWLYDRVGLFNNYQLRRWSGAKVDQPDRPHKLLALSKQVRPVREIRTLGAMWRGWKRIYGLAIEALPEETGRNS